MEKTFMIGREEEIQELLSDLNESKKTSRILHGEAGVGKSRVLDTFYSILKQDNNYKNTHFSGYYDKSKAVIVEPTSYLYPFEVCLLDLIKSIKDSQNTKEQVSSFLDRLKESAIIFAKQEGKDIAIAIIDDLIKKAGFEETASFGKRFINVFKGTKSSITKIEESLSKYQEDDVFRAYLALFEGLAKEYTNREFVLIFDQFESVGKHAIDFLLNLIALLPAERFHLIIGFQTKDRTWRENTIRALFENTRDKIIYDLGGKELELQGLTVNDIEEWIKLVRNKRLPLHPDLYRIKERTAGLPLLLDTWIHKSKDLNYEEIEINNHCQQLTRLSEDLDEQDRIKLNKLCILLNPIDDDEFLTNYLNLDNNNIERYSFFIDRLITVGIFDSKSGWFKHELIKSCFKGDVRGTIKKKYHKEVANYYYSLMEKKENEDNSSKLDYNQVYYKLQHSYAYHLHNAEEYSDSFKYNKKVAEMATHFGDLDEAELCYKRCIDAALKDKNIDENSQKSILFDLSNIYDIWGRYDEALSNYHDLLNYYIQNKMENERANTLNNIGKIHADREKYDKALKNSESLEIARKLGDQRGIALALNNIGVIHQDRGEYDDALKYYDESLEIVRRLGHKQGIAGTLNNIGNIHADREKYDKALKNFEESLEIVRKLGNQTDISRTLNNIGELYRKKGEYNDALKNYEESLEIARKLGDQRGISRSLNNIGIIHADREKYDDALKNYEESLEIARKLGDQRGIAYALNNIGNVHQSKGEYDEALKNFEESLEIVRKLGNQQTIAVILNTIGVVYQNKGEYNDALKNYKESLEIARKLGNQQGIAGTLYNIGNVHQSKGEYDDALKNYEESLDIARKLGNPKIIADLLNNIGIIHQSKGEYDDALKNYEESLEIKRKLGDQQGIANSLINIGNVHQSKGEYDDALKNYEESLVIARKLGNQQNIANSLTNIGVIHNYKGEYDDALKNYEESLVIARKLGNQQNIEWLSEQIDQIKKKIE